MRDSSSRASKPANRNPPSFSADQTSTAQFRQTVEDRRQTTSSSPLPSLNLRACSRRFRVGLTRRAYYARGLSSPREFSVVPSDPAQISDLDDDPRTVSQR